ncbi:MAG: ModD protein [Chlorobiaceae bacterium]
MLYKLPDNEIERFIEEDMPYGDLTTFLLGIGQQPGTITFTSREITTICCTEEAACVFARCGASVNFFLKSGTTVGADVPILSATGYANALHSGWKVALNLLEYASGITTLTKNIVDQAKNVNPGVSVVTTRKSFPGTKKIAIKAIMAGGALPHRLGMSESVLVFRHHTDFLGGLDSFLQTVEALKAKVPEHKIIVEAETTEDAFKIAAAGVDVIQIDKLVPEQLLPLVQQLRKEYPAGITISAAGGITAENVAFYAKTGVDILVLSSVYFAKPADIAVSMYVVTTQKTVHF